MTELNRIFKNWMYLRRKRWFERMLKDTGSGMSEMIQNHATELAMKMVTNWLDRKRIMHCTECPATDSLRKIGSIYFCSRHLKAEADKPAPAAVEAA